MSIKLTYLPYIKSKSAIVDVNGTYPYWKNDVWMELRDGENYLIGSDTTSRHKLTKALSYNLLEEKDKNDDFIKGENIFKDFVAFDNSKEIVTLGIPVTIGLVDLISMKKNDRKKIITEIWGDINNQNSYKSIVKNFNDNNFIDNVKFYADGDITFCKRAIQSASRSEREILNMEFACKSAIKSKIPWVVVKIEGYLSDFVVEKILKIIKQNAANNINTFVDVAALSDYYNFFDVSFASGQIGLAHRIEKK